MLPAHMLTCTSATLHGCTLHAEPCIDVLIVQRDERFRFGEGTGVRKYLAAEIAPGHEPHEALSTWAADSTPQQSAELLPYQAQPTNLHKKSLLTFAGVPATHKAVMPAQKFLWALQSRQSCMITLNISHLASVVQCKEHKGKMSHLCQHV